MQASPTLQTARFDHKDTSFGGGRTTLAYQSEVGCVSGCTVARMANRNVASVLVVTPYPDDRNSTRDLHALVFEVSECTRVDVHVWFLRCADFQKPWPQTRVVDHLRTWWPAAALSAMGLERVAGLLRASRLRRWFRQVDPDIVVLDDGFGERLLQYAPRPSRRVVRLNSEAPMASMLEAPVRGPVDLLLVDPASDLPEPVAIERRVLGAYDGFRPDVRADSDEGARIAARRDLDLPKGPLVVGWGHEGWLDGPDLFVRVLWALRRKGVDVDAAWLGIGESSDDGKRLRAEAERCGISERIHLRADASRPARLCGDVVLRPDRSGGRSPEELIQAILAGCPVVAFSEVEAIDEGITVVPALDVEAAAAALVPLLDPASLAGREARRREAGLRLDLQASFLRLLDSRGDEPA